MRVHNYYADVLSSLYAFLNNDVLSAQNRILKVQYNLGNAASMLEYRDSYDLPSAIVKYDSLEPWASMPMAPRSFQMNSSRGGNVTDRFEAIYNATKGISLDVQMQYYNLNTSVTINCKSQMQAINISHEIMQRMPVDRMLNQFSFISFFEMDAKYLNPMAFDVQNDFITNLFLISDQVTNKPVYAFSYSFNPLIRMSSVPQVAMDDVTRSEYQVVLSLEMYIQVPQYIISDQIGISSKSIYRDIPLETAPVGTVSNAKTVIPCYYNHIYFDINNGSIREIVSADVSSIDPITNALTLNGSLTDGSTYSITSDYVGRNINFEYSITHKGDNATGEGTLFIYNSGVSVCRLSGDMYGNILNPTLLESQSTLSGIMIGNHNGLTIDNEPIVLDLAWFRTRPTMINTKLIPSNWVLRHPVVRDVYSVATNVNAYKSTLNFNSTSISSVEIIMISNGVRTKTLLPSPYVLLPDGSFTFQITSPAPLTVSGKINKQTSFIDSIGSSDPAYGILTIDLIPTWDILPYGSSQFDGVSLDVGGTPNMAIPSTSNHDAFVDKIQYLDTNYVAIHSALPYQIINNQIKFSLLIDQSLAPIDPTQINKRFEVYMVHNGVYIDSTNTSSYMIDLNSSIPTELVFIATEDFRLRVLDNVTQYTPLYFGIIILP